MAPNSAGSPTRSSPGATATVTALEPHPGVPLAVSGGEAFPAETQTALHWILRVAVAACFIGHGAFGLITKAAWLPYFAVWGIPERWAWPLMPVVGTVDITVGVLALFRPVRAVIVYMVFWGFHTALLRPLAGEVVWEFLERAGNFGVPFAFLIALGWGRSAADWFAARPAPPLSRVRSEAIAWTLRITAAMLLIGHGGFGFAMQKAEWTAYFGALGVPYTAVEGYALTQAIGWFECALGLMVLAVPVPPILIFAFVWKVGTELLRPIAGEPFWEFIERGGSYAAPLALLALQSRRVLAK
jgi:hypothetical protein